MKEKKLIKKCLYCYKTIIKGDFCDNTCKHRYKSGGNKGKVQNKPVICKVCYKEFTPLNKRQSFCSKSCKQEGNRVRMLKRQRKEKLSAKASEQELINAILDNPRNILDQLEPETEKLRDIRLSQGYTRTNRRKPNFKRTYLRACKRCDKIFKGHRKQHFCDECNKNNGKTYKYCEQCKRKFTFTELEEQDFNVCPLCMKPFNK